MFILFYLVLLICIIILHIAGNRKQSMRNFNLIARNDTLIDTILCSKQHDPSDLHMLDLDSILVATNHFSIKNKLGQGGFGPVYKVTCFFS